MRTTISLTTLLILAGALFIRGSQVNRYLKHESLETADFKFPEDVKGIIDQKCYFCHSLKGKSPDAKKALMWDSIPNYSKAKLVAKLDDILDVLNDGSMPPKEVVEKYPAAKLSDEERQLLKGWAESAADSLLN
jgi:uncharacterized membrane protein